MSFELDFLLSVCRKLEMALIPYMLTGSFAANLYAVPRMTRDIDIVIEIHKAQVNKLFQLFEADFYIEKDSIVDAINHDGMFNIIHNDSALKIDFIIRKNASYREIEFQRRRQIHVDNSSIWVVSPEDLVLSKLFWAKDSLSQMQLNDVKNLLKSIKNIDKPYIEKWVDELDLNSIYEKVQADA